uniref:E2F transcription factor 6 n=1 Tax=Cyprinodon variegatus TaxID=28743 RepID=A0A3Q2G192_CYPVA
MLCFPFPRWPTGRRQLAKAVSLRWRKAPKKLIDADEERRDKGEPEPEAFKVRSAGSKLNHVCSSDVSLPVLTRRFLELFVKNPDGTLDLRTAVNSLRTRRRRVYDITNVLEGIQLIKKESLSVCRGSCPASSFLGQNWFQSDASELKLVEETLDSLIRISAQQLFDLTDDPENSLLTLAYVTHQDLQRLKTFQNQTLMVVKAPEETKLEIPAPTEDRIQIHLKGGVGPILVMTCDIDTEGSREAGGGFLPLEDSRIKTVELHTEFKKENPATFQDLY